MEQFQTSLDLILGWIILRQNRNKAKDLRRGSRSFQRVPERPIRILIVTDAEKSESSYFEGMKETLSKRASESISIRKGIEAKHLIDKCIELRREKYNLHEIWIVIDKDQHGDQMREGESKDINLDDLVKDAKAKDIIVAWSNPCFEICLHAYFGKMPYAINSVSCVSNFKYEFEKIQGANIRKTTGSCIKR